MMSDQLNYQLRAYSANNVKIQEADYEWAKGLLNEYINKALRNYITSHSNIPFRNLEYTGSHYERLKTEAADEIDVMVVMDTKHLIVEEVDGIPSWVKIKAKNSDTPFSKYVNNNGYLLPEKMRSRLISLVNKAKNYFVAEEYKDGPVSFEVRAHGPAVQLDITEIATGKKLSIDLVLSFQFENDFYVAKPYKVSNAPNVPHSNTLLRQSFSVKEKFLLKDMDKMDTGCRHELLRIVKTIVRNDSALKGKLTTYHLKTVFLRYNEDQSISWHRNDLSQRFLGYIESLIEAIQNKKLPHFFLPEVNLLEETDDVVCSNMACRLQRLLKSEKEMNKILKVPASDSLSLQLPLNNLSISDNSGNNVNGTSSKGTLEIIRKFVDDMGNAAKKFTKNPKDVFNQVVKNKLLKNCKESNSGFISTLEYSGNLYEGLFTEGQDDDDAIVLAILKTKKNNSDVKPDIHKDYATFTVVPGSQYAQFCKEEMVVNPDKMADWFFKVVQREAQKCSGVEISVTPPQKGKNHVVKLIINLNSAEPSSLEERAKPCLTVILLPAFAVDEQFFVPLDPPNAGIGNKWRRSFAMEKKAVLQNMDKDGGCRHDLFKVVTTILKREPTFSLLLVHIKMMFVVYIHQGKDGLTKKWEKSKLDERFDEFLKFMADSLQKKTLMHFWVNDLNLLSSIPSVTLGNMEKRIRRILSSQQELEKVLTFSRQALASVL